MRFIKYHGLGNDFILLAPDAPAAFEGPGLTPDDARSLCARGTGVGADGLVALRRSVTADVRMELLNSDGSTPEMCGNGLRCLVKYAVEELNLPASPLIVETVAGLKTCFATTDSAGRVTSVRVDMGPISFRPVDVPMTLGAIPSDSDEAIAWPVPCEERTFIATGVNVGNPHLVTFGDATEATAARWGPQLTGHPWWPEGTNVEFAELVGDAHIALTVWERGCGLTQACGTGATATAAAAVRQGQMPHGTPITVTLPGGDLVVTVEPGFARVWMEGPAAEVYRGRLSSPWRL